MSQPESDNTGPYQAPKSNLSQTVEVDAPVRVGKLGHMVLLLLTLVICLVLPAIVFVGFNVAKRFDLFYNEPVNFTMAVLKAYLRVNYFTYDVFYSLVLYFYAWMTRSTLKGYYRLYNFFHYSLMSAILYTLALLLMLYIQNETVYDAFEKNRYEYTTIAVLCGVVVCWVWQLAFNRARRRAQNLKTNVS